MRRSYTLSFLARSMIFTLVRGSKPKAASSAACFSA
ncbi:MAG: hypothetical protein H6R31_236 [Methanomicrobia archaeon]|nr:hypothetical protein [Methanomicrobia archaeon]